MPSKLTSRVQLVACLQDMLKREVAVFVLNTILHCTQQGIGPDFAQVERFACYMTGEWRDKAARLCSAGRSPVKAGSLVVRVAIAHVAVLARSLCLCQRLDFESHVC